MSIPALVIAFNRPEKLQQTLLSLARTDVKEVVVSLDGPRANKNDGIRIAECIHIIEGFREVFDVLSINQNYENLGCRRALQKAIGNFFNIYDRGVIIEDDILVSQQFIDFAAWALEEYENDNNIWVINGWSPFNLGEINPLPWLSRIPIVWGWATWRDRWDMYDSEIEDSASLKPSELKTNLSLPFSSEFDNYWTNGFKQIREGFDTWDYQLVFSMWKNGGMALTPPSRLTQNIGFDEEATHTFQPSGRSNLKLEERCLDQKSFAYREYSHQRIIESERIQFGYNLNKPRILNPSTLLQKFEKSLFALADSLDKSGHTSTNVGAALKMNIVKFAWSTHRLVITLRLSAKGFISRFRAKLRYSRTRNRIRKASDYIYWGIRSRLSRVRNRLGKVFNYIYWGIRSRLSRVRNRLGKVFNYIYWGIRSRLKRLIKGNNG
jgi:hypothetical protein